MKKYLNIIIFLLLGFQGIAQQKKTHEFDEQNRLSKVFYWNNGSVTATIIYTFDEVGNRKTKVINTTVSPQTIAISSPTSGTFTAGQSVSVSYASSGGTAPVSLELVSCTNATAIAVVGDGVAASGTINYTLPSNLTAGQYHIKAYVTGTTGTPYYGTCFTVNPITTQTIAISSPTSGTFSAGQSVSVSYTSTGGSANVSLELVSCTGTTAIALIGDGVAASGSISYSLPSNLTTGQYRIKAYITGTTGTPFYGTCFVINAIAAQTIAISSPVSGTFTAGQSVAVTYTSSGGTSPISLELVSCTGTIALVVIADGVSASGTVNFTLPSNLSTGQYRIKAYVTGTIGQATYANCFTINGLSTQTIAINSPVSGTFSAGQNLTVNYASTSGSANVSLELVNCTGSTALAIIADGVSASGSVNFTLPSNLSTGQYRIKAYITGTTGQAVYGTCFTVNAVAAQTIAISSPVSGTFTAGQSVAVTYASSGGTSPVSLELVSCTGTTALAIITDGVSASGTVNFTLPSNLSTGQYRIKAYVTGTTGQGYYGACITVNAGSDCPPSLTHSGIITANTYQASQTIVSTAKISNNTKYYSGHSATFLPGFLVEGGVNFEAKIQGCITVPTNGLVAYYGLDGNTNDGSGNGNNLTSTGTTSSVADRKNQPLKATSYGGNTSVGYQSASNSTSLQFTTGFSVSLWYKIPSYAGMDGYRRQNANGYQVLVAKEGDRSGFSIGVSNDVVNNKQSINFTNNPSSGVNNFNITATPDGNSANNLNKWIHLVVTAGDGNVKIFIDGVLKNTASVSSINFSGMNSKNLFLGTMQALGTYWYPYSGALDEVRIYNRALSDTEVQTLYYLEKP